VLMVLHFAGLTAVSQSPHLGATEPEWLFHREKAALKFHPNRAQQLWNRYRRWAVASVILLVTLAQVPGRPQSAEHPPTRAPQVSILRPGSDHPARRVNPQDAYTLPPALLQKAVVLSRIRNILGFGG